LPEVSQTTIQPAALYEPSVELPKAVRTFRSTLWGGSEGLVEYARIPVLTAIGVIGILTPLGGQVRQVFRQIGDGLAR
jgi:hypothetical protein